MHDGDSMTPGYKIASAAGLPPPDELVLRHGELVKRIAYHVVSRLPSHIEVDDLIQAGMIGLLNAAQNFAPTKGANFETYAGIRIRGAMLDEARRSRSARSRIARAATPRHKRSPALSGLASRSTTVWSRARPRAAS
jgi:DNA-directed RNA polymerase specialized sigma subunit